MSSTVLDATTVPGVLARFVDASNHITLFHVPASNRVDLQKLVAGVTTTIGTSPLTLAVDATATLRLEVDGANPTIVRGYVNGALVIGPAIVADAALQGIGRAGVRTRLNGRVSSVSLAALTGLSQGLLRVDAEVYPYLGGMRTTDPLGTRAMTDARFIAYRTVAAVPWVIGYDPAGTRYNGMWAFVDPVNGATTPAAAMVATTLAGAKAIAPASRPRSISIAIQAGRLVARTLPAANGQAVQTNSVDGMRVVLPAGTTTGGFGSLAVGSGTTTAEIPLVVEGDPDNANPRANVILRGGTGQVNIRAARLRVRNMTVEHGSTAMNSNTTYSLFLDNVEIRAAAGQEAVTSAPFNGVTPAPATEWGWCVTRSRLWRSSVQLGGASRQIGLLRACENSRRATATVIVKCRWIPPEEDGVVTNANNIQGYGTTAQTVNLGHLEDVMFAYNDVRSIRWQAWVTSAAPAALAGTVLPQTKRMLILNNVWERYSGTNGVSTTSDSQGGFGENELVEVTDCIVEGNTQAGAAFNCFYNDPIPLTLADIDSQNNIMTNIRHASNATDRCASKQDDFSDGSTQAVRVAAGLTGSAATGYRTAVLGAWSTHFGTGMEAHVDFGRRGSISDFRREGVGLRGVQFSVPTAPGWLDDRSEAGTDAGGGDYTPIAGSPLLGRVRRANSDRDWAGNPRLMNGAAGALEAVAAGTALVAQGSRHAHRAAASLVGIAFTASPANARMGTAAGSAIVTWRTTVAPATSFLQPKSSVPTVTVAGGLGLIAPDASRLTFVSPPILLLPDGNVSPDRSFLVRADARTLLVTITEQEI